MATQQATNSVIKVEPTIVTPEIDFGPGQSLPFDCVLLTRRYLSTIGATPPRVSHDWDCNLWWYLVVDGSEVAQSLADIDVACTYWDPVVRSAETLTVAKGAGTGQIKLSTSAAEGLTAGHYRFRVTGTETEVFEICSGWLDILPEVD